MDNQVDSLKIKIDAARANLTEETRNSIDRVPWRDIIIKMRETKGYSFEQLGNLETETELLLCGILQPDEYSKILEKELGMTRGQVNELMEEMNKSIFSKIREEFVKIIEEKEKRPETVKPNPSGIKIKTILDQKLTGEVKNQNTVTDHTIKNTPTSIQANSTKNGDPYREIPE
jgi:hypothetical protein